MTKKVLFICPKFFGYELKIKKQLEKTGYKVDYIDERPSNGILYKLVLRLGGNILSKYNFNYYKKMLSNLDAIYDFVFYINIEALDYKSINMLKEKFSNARHILYMWDSSKNKPKYLNLIDLFDAVYSFDFSDSINYKNIEYMPLFSCMEKDNSYSKEYFLSFVGTVHSDRFNILMDIKRIAEKQGVNIYLYMYYHSRILWFLRCIFDKNLRISDYNKVNFKPLSYIEFERVVKKSIYSIDINHDQQTGFTMRTFEVLCAGTKLFTTNKMILESDFYKDNMICFFNKNEILLPDIYCSTAVPDYSDYYLDSWLNKIIK
ncbi:TPA: hypothetical protein ACX6Q1_003704 [Photobacterium damselae]